MQFLKTKYEINGKIYLFDIDALKSAIDIRRGNSGLEAYINSLSDNIDAPRGRTVSDWMKGVHDPKTVKQVLHLLNCMQVDQSIVFIPSDIALDPEYENNKIRQFERKINAKRKRQKIKMSFLINYLFYQVGYSISLWMMYRILTGKTIVQKEVLYEIDAILEKYQEATITEKYKTKFKFGNGTNRKIENQYKMIFVGYVFVAKILKYEFEISISPYQLCGIINGILNPSEKINHALKSIIDRAEICTITNLYGDGYTNDGNQINEPYERTADGEWYVPILIGNDSLFMQYKKYNIMKKYCKLKGKKMYINSVHGFRISTLWDIKNAFFIAEHNFSKILIYSNRDYIDKSIEALISNYSKKNNVPIEYIHRVNET